MGVLPTGSLDPHVLYSQPYRTEVLALFVRTGTASRFRARTFSDLFVLLRAGKFRLGVAQNYSYGPEVDPWIRRSSGR